MSSRLPARSSTACTNTGGGRCSSARTRHDGSHSGTEKGGSMIACLRTVVVPSERGEDYLAWIREGRAVREAHGILAELVLEPASRDGDTVVLTIWPSH